MILITCLTILILYLCILLIITNKKVNNFRELLRLEIIKNMGLRDKISKYNNDEIKMKLQKRDKER